MAVVYAGWHEPLERPVALKVLAEHLAGDPAFRARFLREARIASKLQHPNLVQTFDITELGGLPCIVMELVTGGTLEGDVLTREEAAEVALGLAHAHERGVVHRDLKPANLLRAPDRVKIADFGIARGLEETMVTQIGTVLGTMRYLAPEQAEGHVAGTEADVYSLGVVFGELLAAATQEDRKLIERMCAPDPAQRPYASEVAASLGATQVLHARPPRRRRPTFTGRSKLLAGAAGAAVAAAIVVAATGGRHQPARIDPVPHAATPAAQARELAAWLERYSR